MTVALSQLNFRDLGSLPLGEGRELPAGRLYRSEGPASFDEAHRRELAALGIRLVCDLRSGGEREAAPNDWTDEAHHLNLDVNQDHHVAQNGAWREVLMADPTERGARTALRTNYESMPAAMQPHFGRFFEAVLAGRMPVLVHCTAGKDRTGVFVALLLLQLGVPRDAVMGDYLKSEIFAKNMRNAARPSPTDFKKVFGFEPDAGVMEAMCNVYPEYLDAALDAVDRRWGSVANYFAEIGVDGARTDAVRDALAG
jgi:protein-tyrosine phosphatase